MNNYQFFLKKAIATTMANLIATNLTCPHSECLEVWLQLCFQNVFFLEMHQNNIFFIF
jgi:hypothetical protein